MTNAALQMLSPEAVTELGLVLSRSGRKMRVTTPSGERGADIAASCILSPAPGDRVLVVHAGEECYVLAVLRQHRDGEAQLVFERDVSLNVLKGKLRIAAQEGVELETGQVKLAFSILDLVGESIVSKTKKVRVVAETFDTIAGRLYQRAVNFLRRTDELDRVEAKNMDRRAEQLMHNHSENAVTTAEHLVKIDAGQVHVG